MQTLPSSEVAFLALKMRDELKIEMREKFHIISRLGATGVKMGVLGAQKFNFLEKQQSLQGSKVSKFLTLISHLNEFFFCDS